MAREFSDLSKEELIELLLKKNLENTSLQNTVKDLKTNVKDLKTNVKTLTNDVKVLKRYLYGKKNEKVTKEDKRQELLFDELEETLYSEEEQEHETPKATKPS